MKIRHAASLTALALANRFLPLSSVGAADDRGFLNAVFVNSGDGTYVVS